MRVVAGALVASVLSVGCLASCSDSSQGEPSTTTAASAVAPPDVAAIGPAVAALEAELGGPQQYFEINADSQLVNLFVAVPAAGSDPTAVGYTYVGGVLSPDPTELGAASGSTFAASALGFDPATVLDGVRGVLPGTTLERFVVIGAGEGAVQLGVDAVSAQGGRLQVVLDATGQVVEVTPQ